MSVRLTKNERVRRFRECEQLFLEDFPFAQSLYLINVCRDYIRGTIDYIILVQCLKIQGKLHHCSYTRYLTPLKRTKVFLSDVKLTKAKAVLITDEKEIIMPGLADGL